MVKFFYVLGGIFYLFTMVDPFLIASGSLEPIGALYDFLAGTACFLIGYGIDCYKKGV